jgi:hypothetical protein
MEAEIPLNIVKIAEPLWSPRGIVLEYSDQASHTGLTFHAQVFLLVVKLIARRCLLNIELGAVISRLYNNRNVPASDTEYLLVEQLRGSLLAWRSKVSPRVLLDASYLPLVCPPPHILTLK